MELKDNELDSFKTLIDLSSDNIFNHEFASLVVELIAFNPNY
jgi:hypothetical protein